MAAAALTYLAIDLGATSGRAVVGTLEGATMRTHEVHRFRTPLVETAGNLRWDIDGLWTDIKSGLARALDAAPALRSVSVDSWAVDYVSLGPDGTPLYLPYSYRDRRTAGRLAGALAVAGGARALYARTGIQFLEFNTLPQVVCDVQDEPADVARTASRLMIAEYFLYRLSGRRVAERTNASTTQLLDARTGRWADDIIRAIGDDPARWPSVERAGTVLGPVQHEAMPAGMAHVPLVLATCAHDTAAAVAAVPAADGRAFAYISSGTWSLLGTELDAPLLSPEACEAGFTNEAGLGDTVRLLKNRMGMWVLEECTREWSADGGRPSYDALLADAAREPDGAILDLNAPAFAERGDTVAKIEAACRAHGVPVPPSRGALVRLVLGSLAADYARTLAQLETLTGKHAEYLHIVGGGARNGLLNQLAADACQRTVVAGPDEAAVLGNLLVQAHALGDLPAGVSVREAARRSASTSTYIPRSAGHRPAARSAF